LTQELADVEAELEFQQERLRGARSAEAALGRSPRTPTPLRASLQDEVARLRSRRRELNDFIEGVDDALSRPFEPEPVHAHLFHRALPIDETAIPRGRLLRFWTAASTAILLAALGVLLIVDGTSAVSIAEIAGVMLVIEAVLRRRLIALIAGLAVIGVAVVGVWAVFSLFIGNIADALGVALLFGAIYLAITTIREGFATR
jgi:hypothetical protein